MSPILLIKLIFRDPMIPWKRIILLVLQGERVRIVFVDGPSSS